MQTAGPPIAPGPAPAVPASGRLAWLPVRRLDRAEAAAVRERGGAVVVDRRGSAAGPQRPQDAGGH
jgi:hypothetical protein